MTRRGRSEDVESARNVRQRHAPPDVAIENPDVAIEDNPGAYVDAFVEYCKGNLSPAASEEEDRQKLMLLLCRRSEHKPEGEFDNHDEWCNSVLRGGESLNETPHVRYDEEGYDPSSQMARIANALRDHHAQKDLLDENEKKVLEIPGWSEAVWNGMYWNCRCKTCNGYDRYMKSYKYQYIEVLERRFPWYFNDNQNEKDIREKYHLEIESNYKILKRSELLKFAKDHWKTFFQPMQDLMRRRPAILPQNVPELETDHVKEMYKNNCKKFNMEDHCDEIFESHEGQQFLSQRSCATHALLNECRRKALQYGVLPELEQLEPPFETEIECNFEGTRNDHYCLGSRRYGNKRYTGLTDNLEERHRQHAGLHDKFSGSAFIAVLTGLKKCRSPGCTCTRLKPLAPRGEEIRAAPDPYGGFKLKEKKSTAGKITAACTDGPYKYTESEENDMTIKLVRSSGIFHARGGEYVTTEASFCSDVSMAVRLFANAGVACTECSEPGHHRTRCPRRHQGKNEDETRHMLWNLDCDKVDHRTSDSYHDFAKRITLALVKNARNADNGLHIGRIVQLSDEDKEPALVESVEDDVVKQIISALYSDLRLRHLQKEALSSVLCPRRPDITLTLPTAYGKTLVYLVAAVYEILQARRCNGQNMTGNQKRRGKVVVFLPYRALMSDVAETLARLTDPYANDTHINAFVDFDENRCVVSGRVVNNERKLNKIFRFLNGRIVVNEDGGLPGISMPYAGEFYVPSADDPASPESIQWTTWRGTSGDFNMAALEKTKIFKDADIVFATPDKWSWSGPSQENKQNSCDAFIKTFGEEFLGSLRLCIIDEAHEFRETLGGNMRELLKRMEEMKKHIPTSNHSGANRYRMLVISATIPDPQEFTKDLTGRDGSNLSIVPEPQQEASQHARTQTCIPLPEDPEDDPEEEDVHCMFESMKQGNMQGARHKALVIFKDVITPENLCKKLMIPINLAGVRRVLIFVDSRDFATKIFKLMGADYFVKCWREHGHEITVTPYHAGVADSSRRLCEKKMAEYVRVAADGSAQQVHFIIATSALEAGVNIMGVDAIVILSATACNRRSLIQRIGRGGREKDKPTVIMIGYPSAPIAYADDANEDINIPDDSHTSEGQSATPVDVEAGNDDEDINTPEDSSDFMRHPKSFLMLNDAFSVCSTRAMRIHGACQFLSALIYFKGEYNSRDVEESVIKLIKRDDELISLPSQLDHCSNFLENWSTALNDWLTGELPVSEEAMTMRAISGRSFPLYEAPNLVHIQRYNNRLIRTGNRYKDLGRVSEAMMFRNLHWNAQFHTPHGRLVRVMSYVLKTDNQIRSRWNDRIDAIIVQRVERGSRASPYVTLGDSHEHVQFLSDSNLGADHESERSEASVKVGKVLVKTTWLGYSYRNPHDFSKVSNMSPQLIHLYNDWIIKIEATMGDHPVADQLFRSWEFFRPAESFKNGWRWNIVPDFPLADNPMRAKVLQVLCAELRLRLSNKMHFSPRQITICISSRKLQDRITKAEEDIRTAWDNNDDGGDDPPKKSYQNLKLQDEKAWQEDPSAKLILFEHSNAGIATECLRVLLPPQDERGSPLFVTDKFELDDELRLKSLWDFQVKRAWEESQEELKPLIRSCLEWLARAARDVDQREAWK